jgi:hypothetical protein
MNRKEFVIDHLLIQRICIAFRGVLNPRQVQRKTSVRLATLVLSWNVMKF